MLPPFPNVAIASDLLSSSPPSEDKRLDVGANEPTVSMLHLQAIEARLEAVEAFCGGQVAHNQAVDEQIEGLP